MSWTDKVTKPNSAEKLNATDRLIKEHQNQVYTVKGVDSTGRNAWYVALIEKQKIPIFLAKKNGDSYNLEDFGKIIISGYGTEVPEQVKKDLKEKYGFENF